MMLPTTVRTFFVAALFSLPLSMPLHADEDGLSNALSRELGASQDASNRSDEVKQQLQDESLFTSDRANDADEGIPNEPSSPSDNGDEQTPPVKLEDTNPGDKQDGENPGEHEPKHNNPPKSDKIDDEKLRHGTYDFEHIASFLKHCPTLLQKLYESVWFQVQTVGALTVIPFMTYKTLVHLKQLFTDKEKRGKHALRTLLYATSGIITLKAFIQYVLELNAQVAQGNA